MSLNDEPRRTMGVRRGSEARVSKATDAQTSSKTQKALQRTRPMRKTTRLQGELVSVLSDIQVAARKTNREVEDGVGLNDGHWAHIKTPNSPSGRGGTWKTFQEIVDWVERDLKKRITWTVIDLVDSAPTNFDTDDVNHAARQIRHWRHRQFFADLGRKGGIATARRHGPSFAQERGRLGGLAKARNRRRNRQEPAR